MLESQAPIRITGLAILVVAVSLAAAQDLVSSRAPELPVLAPIDATDQLPYFIARGTNESAFRDADRDLATWALQAWERSLNGKLSFTPVPESSALLRVHWVPASFGQYGEMRPILVDGRRGASVYIRPDTDALGAAIATRSREDPLFRDTVVYLTCLHEIGHALGLEHTAEFDDIMYFFGFGGDILEYFDRYREQLSSRQDIPNVSGISNGDLAQLTALYAGE